MVVNYRWKTTATPQPLAVILTFQEHLRGICTNESRSYLQLTNFQWATSWHPPSQQLVVMKFGNTWCVTLIAT